MSVRPLIRLLGPGAIVKHYGPGPHDNGSPQSVHGTKSRMTYSPSLEAEIDEVASLLAEAGFVPPMGWNPTIREVSQREINKWAKSQHTNGASSAHTVMVSASWKKLPNSLSESRVDTILHELGHTLDHLEGGKGEKLFQMVENGEVESPSPYALHSPDEMWAEAFLATVKGVASPEVAEYVLSYGRFEGDVSWMREEARITQGGLFIADKAAKLVKHYGPGPHPGTGTPQSVHGAPFLSVGIGDTVNRDVITDAEGNPAPLSMSVLPPDVQEAVIAKAKEFGRTPEDIQANIDMVFESAADRYEAMDADRSWHEGDIAEWLKDREYDGYRDMLVEQKDDKWRWAEKAGSKLRDIDRFYASHHEWLYELSDTHDQPFGEVVGYHAAISPGLRAAENLRFSQLALHYWDANPKFTTEEAAYINEWLDVDQQKILAKGGWRAERIAPQLDFEVEAGDSYRQVMDEAGSEAMARIMYRKTLHNGESLSLGRGYQQHATGLTILYRNADVPTTLSGPKVRSFYNNIVDPFADRGDITIDFQTMNAAFNGYGTGDSDFPTDFLSSPAYKGVKLGVRPLVADAVRRGGEAISSRIKFANAAEMQEVLWAEWKRGLPTSGVGRSKRHGEGKWGLEEIRRIS